MILIARNIGDGGNSRTIAVQRIAGEIVGIGIAVPVPGQIQFIFAYGADAETAAPDVAQFLGGDRQGITPRIVILGIPVAQSVVVCLPWRKVMSV